jgi:DNA-directed RNA polymerase specialized sigma24 family protein
MGAAEEALFIEHQPVAVAAATLVWRRCKALLVVRSIDEDDVHQQAKLLLWGLCPIVIANPPKTNLKGYIFTAVRNRLANSLIPRENHDCVALVDVADETGLDGLVRHIDVQDKIRALPEDSRTFCELLADGVSLHVARRLVQWHGKSAKAKVDYIREHLSSCRE